MDCEQPAQLLLHSLAHLLVFTPAGVYSLIASGGHVEPLTGAIWGCDVYPAVRLTTNASYKVFLRYLMLD